MRTGWQGGWFWKATDQKLLTKDEIMDRYYTSVGHNSNMLLGIVIDTTGVVPAEDCEILAAVGKEIKRRFETPVAEIAGQGKTFELKVGNKPVSVNHIVIQENIVKGERIRKYSVEAFVNGKWQQVCEGISVGNKRIQQFPTIRTDKIRLKIDESAGEPDVKKFAVYYVR
jgi:alpha-L-fucosidase